MGRHTRKAVERPAVAAVILQAVTAAGPYVRTVVQLLLWWQGQG